MKKLIMGMTILSVFLLIGCQNASNPDTQENSSDQTENGSILESESDTNSTEETERESASESATDTSVEDGTETEPVHVHAYVETIENATCEVDGTITYTCECGDSYTETIKSTGHVWGEYVFDDNATYTENATKTATCEKCQQKDTKVVSGTKLEYTYDKLNETMYVTATTNVRDLPSSDGKKLGKLYEEHVITVTGQCRETKWYRFEYKGQVAYISDKYCKTELEYNGYITRYSTDMTILYEQPNTNSKIATKYVSFTPLSLYPCESEGWYMHKSYTNADDDSWVEHIAYIQKQDFLTYKEAEAFLNKGVDAEAYEGLGCVSAPIDFAHNFITTFSSTELDHGCVHIRGQHNIVPTAVVKACGKAWSEAEQRWYDENPVVAYYVDDETIMISDHSIFGAFLSEEEFNSSPYKDTLYVYETYDHYNQAYEQYILDDVYAVLNSST